jgi:probable blue pigment (indigoidine) exporter
MFVRDVVGERRVDHAPPLGRGPARDESGPLEPVDAFAHRARRDHGVLRELAGCPLEGFAGAAQGGQHVELPLGEAVFAIDDRDLVHQKRREPMQTPEDALGRHVEVRSLAFPLGLNAGNMIFAAIAVLAPSTVLVVITLRTRFRTHVCTIPSAEAILTSMEDKWRWVLITAVAPIAWGSTYFVTKQLLPADSPLWGAAIRALPAGILLMLLARRRPLGVWWWRSAVLGILNVGAFFVLLYVAAQLLPSSVAASIMAAGPLVMIGLAWALASERPVPRVVAGALIGMLGVLLIVATSSTGVNAWGVVASASAMVMSALGYVLSKRWASDIPVLSLTAWQLLAGGGALTIAALAFEGTPPALDTGAILGFAYVSVIATALAFWCWFTGLKRLSAGTVGVVGLLNPVTGVLLGTIFAAEPLTIIQIGGVLLVLVGVVVGQQKNEPDQRITRQPGSSEIYPISSPGRER